MRTVLLLIRTVPHFPLIQIKLASVSLVSHLDLWFSSIEAIEVTLISLTWGRIYAFDIIICQECRPDHHKRETIYRPWIISLTALTPFLFSKQQTSTSKYTDRGLYILKLCFFVITKSSHFALLQLHCRTSVYTLTFPRSHGSSFLNSILKASLICCISSCVHTLSRFMR